jgi:hypothetical protein
MVTSENKCGNLFEGSFNRLPMASVSLQQGDQLPQSRQRTTWVSTHRQLLATVLVSHPMRQDLTPTGGLDFNLLEPSAAKSADDQKLTPSVKGVQGIDDGHFARIAGIILGRARASPSLGSLTSSILRFGSGSNCSFLCAKLFSTLIRKGSFTEI